VAGVSIPCHETLLQSHLIRDRFRNSLMLLAASGVLRAPMPAPATDDLTEMLDDRAEYIRRVSVALRSGYGRTQSGRRTG